MHKKQRILDFWLGNPFFFPHLLCQVTCYGVDSEQTSRQKKEMVLEYVCACVWMRGQKEKKKKIDDITRTLQAFGQNERFFGAPSGRMNVPPCLKSVSRVPCFEWIYQIYMRKRRYTRVYARVLQVENLKRIPPMNR